MKENAADTHNRIAPAIVETILTEMHSHGHDADDILVVLESIVAGCFLGMDEDDRMLPRLFEGITWRLEELRKHGVTQ